MAIIACIAIAGLLFVRVPELTPTQTERTQNAGELLGDALIGQTFTSSENMLSGVSVMLATYSGRNNTHAVVLHLYDSVSTENPLRTVSVNPKDFGDNQFYAFSFSPIAKSAGKTFFFTLTSPGSTHGDAVAVNIANTDPYPAGVAYIVREGASTLSPQALQAAGKQPIDLSFGVSHNVPLGVHLVRQVKAAVHTFVSTWHSRRQLYTLWAGAFLPVALFILFATYLFKTSRIVRVSYLLGGIALVALIVRIFYARSLPFTVDEGNYLYDAWTLLHGKLAGGDGYVKAPIFILWTALWEALLGHTALAGRIGSAVAGAGLVYPVYLLVSTLWEKRAGLLSAALWATMGTAIVSTIYTHTQPVAIFFGTSGLALLAYSLKEKKGAWKWALASGIVIGLAVASRKSMLGLGLTVVLLLLYLSPTIKDKLKNTAIVGAGFLAVLAIFYASAYGVYGTEGVVEAIGINSASDGVSSIEESQVAQVRAYSLRGMTPLFRESLPLILLSLLGVGFSFKKKVLWLIPLGVFWWAWSFFSEYEGAAFMKYGISMLWPLFFVLLVLAAFLPRKNTGRPFLGYINERSLLGIVWVGSLAFFYMNWIKFHANYISEFIPPLAVMGGVGVEYFITSASRIQHTWLKRGVLIAFIVVAAWAATVSNFITYVFEHTGTFSQRAAKEAASWAKENIPAGEPIFTGAALIPYMSGQQVSLDIAHPRWYAYEFTRTNPKRIETFLPSAKDMVQAYRDANWFLLEGQTGFSFLMEYSEIEGGLEKDWERVQGIENGSNTLTFYKRIHK